MFSSTELIRKSKTIFNKIIDNDISKAIILRDGKPGFLLMDFYKYEEIMAEFETLKKKAKKLNKKLKDDATNKKKPKKIKEDKIVLEKDIKKVEQKDLKQEIKKDPPKPKHKPSHVVPPRPTKEEVVEQIDDDEIIEEKFNDIKDKNKLSIETNEERIDNEPTEEEEIKQALQSIESMNFDGQMKAIAEQKIKDRILKAREERARKKIDEEMENRAALKEELEIQVQIKEDNRKKERELKEFWDLES